MGHKAFNVWLDGVEIDTVFYRGNVTADDVRRSLIDHDGYDDRIEVTCAQMPRYRVRVPLFGFVGYYVAAENAGDAIQVVLEVVPRITMILIMTKIQIATTGRLSASDNNWSGFDEKIV